MEITITGNSEDLDTNGSTVSDAKRVYLIFANPTAGASVLITQTRLQDHTQPFDAVTNPYSITVGTVYVYHSEGLVLQKYSSDMLSTDGSYVGSIKATPIFDRD
jgi:hypothetical protein